MSFSLLKAEKESLEFKHVTQRSNFVLCLSKTIIQLIKLLVNDIVKQFITEIVYVCNPLKFSP